MNKIYIILKREVLATASKKSFIISAVTLPAVFGLLAFFFIRPQANKMQQNSSVTIQVVNEDKISPKLESNAVINYVYSSKSIKDAQDDLLASSDYALLYLQSFSVNEIHRITLYSKQNVDPNLKSLLEKDLIGTLYSGNLDHAGVDLRKFRMDYLTLEVEWVNLYNFTAKGKEKRSRIFLCIFLSLSAFFFIFFWSKEVMTRVLEEKTNRLVEIIITSVRSFHLMLGKILGSLIVEISRVIIGIIIVIVLLPFIPIQSDEVIFSFLSFKEGCEIILFYLFYLIGGFMLYSSLFAAIGAAVDTENESWPFQYPVLGILIFALSVVTSFHNPHNPVAVWASIIPFTSPIVMLMRIPFGVPLWQLIASVVLLIVTFIFTTYMAGKIFKLGILLHGAKVNFKTLLKWILK
jgi:ABC-2 type transport system permease protein